MGGGLKAIPHFAENAPALSPDGRWLAYTSNQSGQHEVFVRPFPDVEAGRWLVSNGPAITPVWAHSGRELFYGTPDGMVVAQVETTATSFRVIGRETLFEILPRSAVGPPTGWYDVTADDQRFLMARRPLVDPGEADVPQLILVRNFFEELEERVGN